MASHRGTFGFTIGQRRGLGISGLAEPRFVTGIAGDTITIGRREDLAVGSLTARGVTWTTDPPDPARTDLTAQVRYHGDPLPVALAVVDDVLAVRFTAEQPTGVAPGQAVVVYHGEECLGGGTITTTSPD